MKTSTNKNGRRDVRTVRAVRLEVFQPGASDVSVAGSFNEWQPRATPMVPLGDGKWVKELTLPDGRYEYLFVVDGSWLPDPAAKESAPNPFGTANSVLTVEAQAWCR